jgi:regulator of sirC expression with transglutaminase-like and TPR domain
MGEIPHSAHGAVQIRTYTRCPRCVGVVCQGFVGGRGLSETLGRNMARPGIHANDGLAEVLADLVQRPDESIDLPTAALVIARVGYPELDIKQYRLRVRALGREALERLGGQPAEDPTDVARIVFEEFGFRPNREEYYDPRNSFLNEVLERRIGIPISLSIIYAEIAQACGRATEGVGFPGHFLVRDLGTGQVLDPYGGGTEVDKHACLKLLRAAGLKPAQWKDEFLAGVGKRDMLLRMIANLQRIYSEREDSERMAILGAMTMRLKKIRELGEAPMIQ